MASTSLFSSKTWSARPIGSSGLAGGTVVPQPKLPTPPASGARSAALGRLASAVARIPNASRGANSTELFLP